MSLLFDGAFGTEFQKISSRNFVNIEEANILLPREVLSIHKSYVDAGADVITTNTFSCLNLLYSGDIKALDYFVSGIKLAKSFKTKIAVSIGPVASLMQPVGECNVDKLYACACSLFSTIDCQVDFILLETFQDLLQLKIVVLAAKDTLPDVPIIASMTFDNSCRTVTGSSPEVFALTISNLGVFAIGANCSFGPENLYEVAKRLIQFSNKSLIYISPNRNVPGQEDLTIQEFTEYTRKYLSLGVSMLGGCCGTTPLFTSAMRMVIQHDMHICQETIERNYRPVICSETNLFEITKGTIIGERINPTGKKSLKQAMLSGDFDYIMSLAVEQVSCGANVLDVNAGVPGLDEAEFLKELICSIQSTVSVPLMIDTTNPEALEKALMVYRGIPIINSVNASEKSLKAVLPLASKYGAYLVALPFEDEVPKSLHTRLTLINKITSEAFKYGIPVTKLLFDILVSPISVDEIYRDLSFDELNFLNSKNLMTIAGVSNCSFGLQNREFINYVFQRDLFASGLTAAIINPCSDLLKQLKNAEDVFYSKSENANTADSLKECIMLGVKPETSKQALSELKSLSSDAVISLVLQAISEVSIKYNEGSIYLSSLVKSAELASEILKTIKVSADSLKKVIMATVKGDFHDIGKNICIAVLSANNVTVIDLGKNVSKEVILASYSEDISAIGLSALLSSSVEEMKNTIDFLRANSVACPIIVGGAVVTKTIAENIGADFYSADAITLAEIVTSLK